MSTHRPRQRRRRLRPAFVAILLHACGAGLVGAQAPPSATLREAGNAPPVDTLVERALESAPSIAARRARLAAAREALKAADTLPDPMVELEFRDAGFPRVTIGSDPMSMTGASIRQPLLGSGRKQARRNEALAAIDQRHAETDALACDITAAVRTTYGEIYAIDQERLVIGDAVELARLLTETATARYASGGSDQAAVLRAQLERTRLAERIADLEAARAIRVVALNRLLNVAPETPLGTVRTLPEPPALAGPLSAMPEAAATAAPEVTARRADVEAAARRVASAREELRPTYTVGGSFYWQGGTDRVVAVTLGIEWPARKARKQLPLIAASERQLEAARFDLEDAAAQARSDAARLAAEIRQAEEQIVRYRAGLLPQSSAAFDAARASYLGGRGDFASVLDELRRWIDIRIELVRRESARFIAQGQLDVLVSPSPHDEWERQSVDAPAASKEPRS